jgi:hypothetical protein
MRLFRRKAAGGKHVTTDQAARLSPITGSSPELITEIPHL